MKTRPELWGPTIFPCRHSYEVSLVSPGRPSLPSNCGKPRKPACRSMFGVLGGDSNYSCSAWMGKVTSWVPPYVSLHTRASSPQCTHLNACVLKSFPQPSLHIPAALPNFFLLIFLSSPMQQVPENVTRNPVVLSRLTAFSCGSMLLSANWIL